MGEKEWEKYRVAFVIQGKPHYLEDDDKSINTKVWFNHSTDGVIFTIFQDFKGISLHGPQPQGTGRPWIGLEHTNKVHSQLHFKIKSFSLFRPTRGQDTITWRRLLKSTTNLNPSNYLCNLNSLWQQLIPIYWALSLKVNQSINCTKSDEKWNVKMWFLRISSDGILLSLILLSC